MLRTTFKISDRQASGHAAGTPWQQSTPILMVDKDYSQLDSADGPTFGCSFQNSVTDTGSDLSGWMIVRLHLGGRQERLKIGEDGVLACSEVREELWCLAGKMWIVFTPESKTGKLRLAFERDASA